MLLYSELSRLVELAQKIENEIETSSPPSPKRKERTQFHQDITLKNKPALALIKECKEKSRKNQDKLKELTKEDPFGLTPLHTVLLRKDFTVAHMLLKHMSITEREVALNARDKNGLTPLMIVLFHNDFRNIVRFKSLGLDLNANNIAGFSLLHYAAYNANLPLCKLLIKAGADIHSTCEIQQNTALHYACMADSVEVAAELLQKGAKLNAFNYDGDTPRRIADLYRSKSVVKVLDDAKVKLNLALFDAVKKEDLQAISDCLKNGADPQYEVSKIAIIHYAAKNSSSAVIDLLLDHDANLIFALDEKERSALLLTSYNVLHKEEAAKKVLGSMFSNPYANERLHVKEIKEVYESKGHSEKVESEKEGYPGLVITLQYGEDAPHRRHSMPSMHLSRVFKN